MRPSIFRILVPCAMLLGVTLMLALSACSGRDHRPLVDFAASPGKTEASYEADLGECRQYADSVSQGEGVAKGGAAGAALGGVASGAAGAILGGDFWSSAGAGAASGAILGGAAGAGSAGGSQAQIINNCMRGRGYSVLQ